MSNVTSFPSPQRVSQIRSRDKALGILLPKLLGVLWERGEPGEIPGSTKAFIGNEIDLPGITIDGRGREIELGGGRNPGVHGAWHIHAYASTPRERWTKVFSAHIGSQMVADPEHFPYWDGRCAVLSWKRGPWEDRIAAERGEPRTVAHLLHAGLTRTKH